MKKAKETNPSHKPAAYWLARAHAMAERSVEKGGSPHPHVKVGAILVDPKGHEIGAAANGFVKGVSHTQAERYDDAVRSLWINCAEQVAIANAAAKGTALKGATLYVTLMPCAICAGLIAQSGIKEVVVPKNACRRNGRLKAKWKRSIAVGREKLSEARIKLTEVDLDRRE